METYQQVDGAAHAVVAAVLTHHGAVVQQPNEEPLHQGHKVLHLRLQRGLLRDAVQQAGTQRSRRQSMCTSVLRMCCFVGKKKANKHNVNSANLAAEQHHPGGSRADCISVTAE